MPPWYDPGAAGGYAAWWRVLHNTGIVAPRAGAWIETILPPGTRFCRWSPPVRGRGSKQRAVQHADAGVRGRPPCGGVDRNLKLAVLNPLQSGRPPCGGVDRNCSGDSMTNVHLVTPRAGTSIAVAVSAKPDSMEVRPNTPALGCETRTPPLAGPVFPPTCRP